MSQETGALAQIHRQIMWNRLIAVVEEQAQTMIRTAFSTTVREAGDLSAGIFDLARTHDGAGRHRHAGPRQLDGGKRRPFPAQVPRRDDAARRSLHHQRSLARHRAPARPHRCHAGLPQRPHRRPVRQHRARHRCRRPRAWVRKDARSSRKACTSRSSNASIGAGRTKPSSISSAPVRAFRSSWKATSTRCAPATTPARTAWPR